MFQVKCEKEWGEYSLSISHNGYQWATLRLKDANEIQAVIRCLRNKIPVLDVDEYYKDD